MITRNICSTICDTAVGVMRCQPCRYPRELARNVTKKTVGASATTAMWARASRMRCQSMSQSAAKYVSREKKIPVKSINPMEMWNTRFAPNISPRATRSAVMMEIATGTPAWETVMAKKYMGNAIW